jgi:hypothetical protein
MRRIDCCAEKGMCGVRRCLVVSEKQLKGECGEHSMAPRQVGQFFGRVDPSMAAELDKIAQDIVRNFEQKMSQVGDPSVPPRPEHAVLSTVNSCRCQLAWSQELLCGTPHM